MDISVVIPAYNEEKNVPILHKEIVSVLKGLKKSYEIVFVDDGSTDSTYDSLVKLNSKDPNVRVVKLRKNFGQTAAMDAGFKAAKGDVVIAMDSDLQNSPSDIPKLLSKLDEGYDVVSGWRHDRKDSFSKVIMSKFANGLRRALTGERIHDSGCSLKAYRKEALKELDLYGEMHRYIPAILMWRGFRIGEVKVSHHQRKFGKTKYNFRRLIRGFLDLIIVLFWQKYSARPIHLFGGLGIIMNILGVIIGAYLTYAKIVYKIGIGDRPLLLLALLLIIIGVQFIVFGILADINLKIYYKDRPNYSIEKIL